MGKAQESARIRAALLALRPKYQAVVALRYYSQLSVPEISEVLGCRQDAVRTRLSRAMKAMRDRLGSRRSDQDTSRTRGR
jgi:RNA polymerase sigma-70 factor (ECF subfamily)